MADQYGTQDEGKRVGRKDTRRAPNFDVDKDSRLHGAKRTDPGKQERELMDTPGDKNKSS